MALPMITFDPVQIPQQQQGPGFFGSVLQGLRDILPQNIAFQQGNQLANEAQDPSTVLDDFVDLFGGASRGLSAINAYEALNVPQTQVIPGNAGAAAGVGRQFYIPGEQQAFNMLLGLGGITGNPPRFR